MYALRPTVIDFSTYTVRGTVTGEVVEGVTVTLSGAADAETVTGADGTFEFAGLRSGVYRVTPSVDIRSDVTFTPESRASISVDGTDVAGIVFESNDDVADTSFLDLEAPGHESFAVDSFAVNANVQTLTGAGVTVTEAEGTITLSGQRRDTVAVGDVIIGDETTRFAKKVTAVDTVKGDTVLTVENATLEDILAQNGAFSFKVTPDWSASRVARGSRGVLQKPFDDYFTTPPDSRALDEGDIDGQGWINLSNVSVLDLMINADRTIDWHNSTIMGESVDPHNLSDSVHEGQFAEGHITVDILSGVLLVTPTFDLAYGLNFGRPWAEGAMDARIVVELEVRFAVTGQAAFHISGALMPTLSVPVTIPTPAGIPIHLDIELEVPAGVKLEAGAGASVTVHQRSEYTVHADIGYTLAGGLSLPAPTTDKTYGVTEITPKLSGYISAEVYLEPTVKVKLYGIVGPYFWVHPYLRGEVFYPLEYTRDELFLGINGGLGLELDTSVFGSYDVKSGPLFDFYLSWDLLGPEDAGTVNTPPTAADQVVDVSNAARGGARLTLTGADADGDTLRYSLASYPTHGNLSSLNPTTGTATYYPYSGYAGTDSFTFTVSDGTDRSDPATATLTVTSAQPPTARFTANADGLTVFLDASGSTDDADVAAGLQVRWDFENDGCWDSGWSTTKTAGYEYAAPGAVVARCQVRDTAGLTAVTARLLNLSAGQSNTMPAPDIQVSVNYLTVSVDASATTDVEDDVAGVPLEFRWAWTSSGAYSGWSTTPTAQHSYSSATEHDLVLQVRDTDGNVTTHERTLSVGRWPDSLPNLFLEIGGVTEQHVDNRLAQAWDHFFGVGAESLYRPARSNADGPTAYILDTGNIRECLLIDAGGFYVDESDLQ